MGMDSFSSGLASNATRYIQETMYMQFISRSIFTLCLFIEEHYFIEFPTNVKVTRVPQDITYKEGDIQYQSSYIQNGNKVEVKRSLYAQRPGAVCQAEELKQFNAFFPVFLSDMRGQIFYE